jgi:hypothetical protein
VARPGSAGDRRRGRPDDPDLFRRALGTIEGLPDRDTQDPAAAGRQGEPRSTGPPRGPEVRDSGSAGEDLNAPNWTSTEVDSGEYEKALTDGRRPMSDAERVTGGRRN